MIRFPYCATAFAVLLGACVVSFAQTQTPNSTEQSATLGDSLRGSQVSAPTRLNLQTATDLLIANNLAVVAARYNVDIQRAQRIAAGLRPHPNLTFGATQFTIPRVFKYPAELFKTNQENGAANTSYTVEVDQLIERGNKRQLRVSQADLNTQVAEAQVKDALRQQIFQLTQAFFTAVLARENLRVLKENLDHFNHTENLLIVQVKEGYSAGVDLKRVQLQRLQFQNDVNGAEQNYQQSIRDVFNLIGAGDTASFANATQLVPTAGTPNAMPGLDASLQVIDGNLDIIPTLLWIDDLRRMALENRPDVKAAELSFKAAEQGVALAAAQRTRDMTVGGQYSRNGSDNTVGMVVGVPIGTRRLTDAAIAQATATKLQAQAQLKQTRNQAITDVEKAFTAYNVSREKLRLFTDSALNTASDVRRIEEIAYRDGAKGLLDYLDAQRTYNQTLVTYNQARFDFLMSLYQLEMATGTTIVK
jgi:cobalt-zinc-cadmium efflux system outer membrane protein